MSESKTMEWRIATTATPHSEHNWIYLEQHFTHKTSRHTLLSISLLHPHTRAVLTLSHEKTLFFEARTIAPQNKILKNIYIYK